MLRQLVSVTGNTSRHKQYISMRTHHDTLRCLNSSGPAVGGEAGTNSDSTTWEDRKTQKACLERYRVASAEIIAVFHEVAPEAVVEKASIDEAYIDVTSIVDAHLQASIKQKHCCCDTMHASAIV